MTACPGATARHAVSGRRRAIPLPDGWCIAAITSPPYGAIVQWSGWDGRWSVGNHNALASTGEYATEPRRVQVASDGQRAFNGWLRP